MTHKALFGPAGENLQFAAGSIEQSYGKKGVSVFKPLQVMRYSGFRSIMSEAFQVTREMINGIQGSRVIQ